MSAIRFVRVDCDFSADGLWNAHGAALSPEHLHLSPALSLALEAWQAHHDATAEIVSDRPFNHAWHESMGRRIAALVQAECPHVEVVYAGDKPYPGDLRPPF